MQPLMRTVHLKVCNVILGYMSLVLVSLQLALKLVNYFPMDKLHTEIKKTVIVNFCNFLVLLENESEIVNGSEVLRRYRLVLTRF